MNDQDIKTLSYAYATTGGAPLDAGVIPARALDLSFWKDTLVSNVFVSSFKEDASNFDASKRTAIVKVRPRARKSSDCSQDRRDTQSIR